MTRGVKFLAIGVLALAATRAAQANTIDVNFGQTGFVHSYTGTGAAPDAGTFWNDVDQPLLLTTSTVSYGPLNDSLTNPTLVTLSVSATGNGFEGYGGVDGGYSQTGAPALMEGVLATTADADIATIVINNLSPSLKYDLYIYEDRGDLVHQSTFTVTDNAGSSQQTSTIDNPLTTGFHTPEDYVLFSSLTPNGSNQLQFQFQAVPGTTYGATNGFQLVSVAVPEPSSVALLVIGTMGMLLLRRRAGVR